jgi:hypothetical protein
MPLSVVVNVNGKTAVFSLSAPDNATTWSHAARWSPDAERDRGPLRPSATATSEPSTGREKRAFQRRRSAGARKAVQGMVRYWCANATAERRVQSSPVREPCRTSARGRQVPSRVAGAVELRSGRRGGRPEHLLSPPAAAPTRAACKTDTAVRVRISDPDLLLALCDYLSEQGLIAVAASQETANVLVQTAQSDLDAELLVLAALRRWRVERPDVSVTVAPEQ